MRIRLAWVPLILPCVLFACDTRDKVAGVYCDKNEDCAAGLVCDTSFHSCYSPTNCVTTCEQNDLSVDLSVQCEMRCSGDGGTDLAADLSKQDLETGPDLKPMCGSYADCTDVAKPICDSTINGGSCRPCTTSSDDTQCGMHTATFLCLTDGTNAGKCGACRPANGMAAAGNGCSGTAPVCDVGGTCRACQRHAECPLGICKADGSCAQAGELDYVNNDGGATCLSTGAGAGSMAHPWCQINDAVNKSTKNYVLVAGGVTYSKVVVPDQNLTMTLVGPGFSAAQQAVISPGANRGISINVSGSNTINLTFDGIVISGATGGTGYGVDCVGGDRTKTTFRLLRSQVTTNAQIGVQGSQCYMILDEDSVGPTNGAGGVSLTNCDFSITNSLVFDNGGAGSNFGGVSIGGTFTTKVFSNVTIVKNTCMAALPAGIGCGAPVTVVNTILFGNTTGLDITGACMLDHVAFSGVTATYNLSGCAGGDIFTGYSTDMYKLSATPVPSCSPVPLIDKGTTPNTSPMVPAYALDGTSRPQGAAWDIGAYEQ